MARAAGMGLVLVRNCNHFGWGPAYALEHLDDSLLIGNTTQGAIPIVTPIGGSTATVGSNAIAIAISTAGAEAAPLFLWDSGTAAMSWGEVQKRRLESASLRPGCAVDASGQPTTDAGEAACLLPGGSIGNALGLLVELLGASVGAGDPRVRSAPPDAVPEGEPSTCVFCFFAVDLSRFDGLSFPHGRSRQQNVAAMADAIFGGNGSARMVGLRKWQAKQRSVEHGGLLFAAESITAFEAEALARGIPLPDMRQVEVTFEELAVAAK